MVNICTNIITKGANKGKMCKDVNRWCKHKKIQCSNCKRVFSYQHSFNAHQCSISKPKVQIRVDVKSKAAKCKPSLSEEQQRETQELKNMVHQLKDELDEIRKQPKVQINNLTVITDDIFSKVISQMGEREGVKFLLDSLDDEVECLNIVDKLYLSGKDKNQYPIACRDKNHFRFMGPNSKVVDDVNGDIIVSKLTNSMQNAFLKASADLIKGHIDDNATESLYDMYDIRSVHDRIKQLPLPDHRERFKEGLATKVSNPTHPFFQLED